MLGLVASSIALARGQLARAEQELRRHGLGRQSLFGRSSAGLVHARRAVARLERLGRVVEAVARAQRPGEPFNKEIMMGELIDHPAMFAGSGKEVGKELPWPSLDQLRMGEEEVRPPCLGHWRKRRQYHPVGRP